MQGPSRDTQVRNLLVAICFFAGGIWYACHRAAEWWWLAAIACGASWAAANIYLWRRRRNTILGMVSGASSKPVGWAALGFDAAIASVALLVGVVGVAQLVGPVIPIYQPEPPAESEQRAAEREMLASLRAVESPLHDAVTQATAYPDGRRLAAAIAEASAVVAPHVQTPGFERMRHVTFFRAEELYAAIQGADQAMVNASAAFVQAVHASAGGDDGATVDFCREVERFIQPVRVELLRTPMLASAAHEQCVLISHQLGPEVDRYRFETPFRVAHPALLRAVRLADTAAARQGRVLLQEAREREQQEAARLRREEEAARRARSAPQSIRGNSSGGSCPPGHHWVRPHTRRNGSHVRGHCRRS